MENYSKVKSILYVEDEKGIRDELSEVLENFCEHLYVADDGFQGLKQFKKHNPSIVITDIKMPTMDGVEMSKKIREIDDKARIVFTTAFSDVDFFQEAIELQVNGYILKPISLDALETKILNICEDIRIRDELVEKEQMLLHASKLASMGEMIGNIAHQWKQPLSVISLGINSIRADIELEQLNKEDILIYTDTVSKQVEYLEKTINDFRSFFIPYNPAKTYNLQEFLDKCIDLVRTSLDSDTIETIKDLDSKINAFGDPNQLTQAVINILNNARDAFHEAENLRKKMIFIVTAKEDQDRNLVIIIKDNAGGIPNNIIDRVFEPYFTTKENAGGTGLGLYITHTIIEKNLKGTITVENEVFEYEGQEHKGAKFVITLPLEEV